jgi:cofilin
MSIFNTQLDPDCVSWFDQFTTIHMNDFLTMKFDGDNIVPDFCPMSGNSSKDPRFQDKEHPEFENMVSHLLEEGGGYAFYIFQYDDENGDRCEKLVFYTYVDENSPEETKTKIAFGRIVVERGCPGPWIQIQANCKEDLSYKFGLDIVLKNP